MSRYYTISEIAQETGLSQDTLRYYEKAGLLESPVRGAGSNRMYTDQDLGNIRFILYLRNTMMPLKDIQAYVEAYRRKDESRCIELLDEQRVRVENQMDQLRQTHEIIVYKLEHFQEIKDGGRKDE